MFFRKENIPNFLSLFRIVLAPIYVLLFFGLPPFNSVENNFHAAGFVFLFAGLSDFLDGILARKNNWITDLGKLLDPLADKLMEIAATVCLAIKFKGPFVVLCVIVVLKELLMVFGAYLFVSRIRICVSSNWYGKTATVVWYVLICLLSFFEVMRDNLWISYILCFVLIIIMMLAFFMYIRLYREQIKDTKNVMKNYRLNKDTEHKSTFKETKDFIMKK